MNKPLDCKHIIFFRSDQDKQLKNKRLSNTRLIHVYGISVSYFQNHYKKECMSFDVGHTEHHI